MYKRQAFSCHKSLLFLVNFFQDDTLDAPCKALSISDLIVFRVEQTATLKMIKTLVFRELRAAPQPKSKASIHNRGDAYTIRPPSLTTSEQVTSTISARHPPPHQSQLHTPHPTIATTSEPATSTASDYRNHAPTAVLRSSGSM